MTDKQIRDRIVGALSVSMMPMELEAECVAFLDRCLAKDKNVPGNWIPGTPVWVIERDEDGNASDVSGYVFLARCEEVVILSSYVNDYDFEGILEYHVQCTAEDYDTHLCVFPAVDCFLSEADCDAAFEAEQEDQECQT